MPTSKTSRATARDALVASAIDHLAKYGPAGVQPQEICKELGISKALVNYHFGTREGLIAEAMVAAYEQSVEIINSAAQAAAPNDPVERLFAWIDADIEWARDHQGLAAALDFPEAAIGRSTLDDDLEERLGEANRRNFELLTTLVRDARVALKNDPSWQPDEEQIALDAGVIGWLALGVSVWVGGSNLPARQTRVRQFMPLARDHMRTLLLEMLSR